jgi:hypothetical protein
MDGGKRVMGRSSGDDIGEGLLKGSNGRSDGE